MTSRSPPDPSPGTDPHWQAMVLAAAMGDPIHCELYADAFQKPNVRAWYAILTERKTVRVGILFYEPDETGTRLRHFESDRQQAAAWLRYHGIPCLRLGTRLQERLLIYPKQTNGEKRHGR